MDLDFSIELCSHHQSMNFAERERIRLGLCFFRLERLLADDLDGMARSCRVLDLIYACKATLIGVKRRST